MRNPHFPWPPKTWQDDCGFWKSASAHGERVTDEERLGDGEMADWDFWDQGEYSQECLERIIF